MFRVTIVGSRTFQDFEFLEQEVLKILTNFSGIEIEIVSGGAQGADKLAEKFAKKYEIPIRIFPANWTYYGKRAGYVRNKAMAEYSDLVIAFWDGKSKGTKLMLNLAKQNNCETSTILY